MRKTVAVILVASIMMASFAAPGYCDAARKLSRGLANMCTFPLEIPNRMVEADKRGGLSVAFSYGLIEGFAMAFGRALVGFWETATFFMPMPPNYEPILTDPEFFIQLSGEEAKTQKVK